MALIYRTVPEDPNVRRARVITETAKQMFSQMLAGRQRMFAATWKDDPNFPDEEFDPQAIMDLLSTDAGGLFETGFLVDQVLLSQEENAIPAEDRVPFRLPTINPDGTVTLAPP